MKHLAFFALLILAFAGCQKPQQQVQQPQPIIVQPPQQQVQPQPQPSQPAQPSVPHSSAWISGYNDGYNGNWLGPASWLVSNEYRAGWSAGNRDMKEGRPHRLHP